jgi:hypothetical protein
VQRWVRFVRSGGILPNVLSALTGQMALDSQLIADSGGQSAPTSVIRATFGVICWCSAMEVRAFRRLRVDESCALLTGLSLESPGGRKLPGRSKRPRV